MKSDTQAVIVIVLVLPAFVAAVSFKGIFWGSALLKMWGWI